MLQRTRRRKKRRSAVWSAAHLMIAAMGLYSLYIGASSVTEGEVETFSRFSRGLIQVAEQPVAFWFTTGLWITGGIFMLGVSVYGWVTASA